MENPTRTAQHVARLSERRIRLNERVGELVSHNRLITWEIGCGHGHFLTAYAAAHPEELCIGVDITLDRIERGDRKRTRARLENLHFVHADARDFLESLPPETRFHAIFILFPDPWPKRRHEKNRIMQPEFLARLAERAGEASRLHFRTDYEPYFRDTEALLDHHPGWQPIEEPWPFEFETVFQSRAERHYSLTARRRSP